MTPVPSGALTRLPETLTSGETQGPGGRDFGPAQPHRRAQEQRPPPSTHPFGATSNRSSRTTRTGESAIGLSSDRRDRDPHCPARKPATSPTRLNQRQRAKPNPARLGRAIGTSQFGRAMVRRDTARLQDGRTERDAELRSVPTERPDPPPSARSSLIGPKRFANPTTSKGIAQSILRLPCLVSGSCHRPTSCHLHEGSFRENTTTRAPCNHYPILRRSRRTTFIRSSGAGHTTFRLCSTSDSRPNPSSFRLVQKPNDQCVDPASNHPRHPNTGLVP
jgi:hypothetical protein